MEMETRKVRLMQRQDKPGTAKAALFMDPVTKKDVWIPLSVLHHVSREISLEEFKEGGLFDCVVEVDEWFADDRGL